MYDYSYIKIIDDIQDLYNFIYNSITIISYINYNKLNSTVTLYFTSELNGTQKETLDSLIVDYIPKLAIDNSSIIKYYSRYNESKINLSSTYQLLNINGISFDDKDIFITNNGNIKFLKSCEYVIFGYINIVNGGELSIQFTRNGIPLQIPYVKIYNSGIFFLPVLGPTLNDYVTIKGKSTTNGYIDYNSFTINICKAYSGVEYKQTDTFYSFLPPIYTIVESEWNDIYFSMIVIKCDPSYTMNGNVIQLNNIDNYMLFLQITSDILNDVRVLINDIPDDTLNFNTRTGLITIVNNITENSTIRFQVKRNNNFEGTPHIKDSSILILRLQANSSLDTYLSQIIQPKSIVCYNSDSELSAKYFKAIPDLQNKFIDDIYEIIESNKIKMLNSGKYLICYQVNTLDDITLQISINDNIHIITHSNMYNSILYLKENDTLFVKVQSNDNIVYDNVLSTVIRVDPEYTYSDNYILYKAITEPIITNSISYVDILNYITDNITIGIYNLLVKSNIKMTINNKDFSINIMINNISLYSKIYTYKNMDIDLGISLHVPIIENNIQNIVIQLKTTDNNDICIINSMSCDFTRSP